MLRGKTLWITGATGRVGCELTRRVEDLGGHAVPLVLEGYPTRPRRCDWTAESSPIAVTSPRDLAALPPPDALVNLHWHVDRSLSFTGQLHQELAWNVHGLRALWDRVEETGCSRFVNVSSMAVFSHLNAPPVRAATEPRPATAYGIAKLAGEKYFDARFAASGVRSAHVRLCAVAAWGGHPSQLLPRLCRSAFHGERIRIHRRHHLSLIHVDEAVDLLVSAALREDTGPFLIAPPAQAVGGMAEAFRRVTGRDLVADYDDAPSPTQNPEAVSDAGRLAEPWIRRKDLDALIRSIVDMEIGRDVPMPTTPPA